MTFDPQCDSDLARLRNAVAGMTKNLVAARAKIDPSWCEAEGIDQQWFPTTQRPQNRSPIYLLEQAVAGFRRFNEGYSGPLDSVPFVEEKTDSDSATCLHEEDESPTALVERLRDLLCQFVGLDDLTFATDQLRRRVIVNWAKLANWKLLPQLRGLLDDLPEQKDQQFVRFGDGRLSVDAKNAYVCGSQQHCSNQVHEFLYYLLQQASRSCQVADLAEPIWRDRSRAVTFGQVDSVLKRVRKWFEVNHVPFKVKRDGTEITMTDGPMESAT